MFTRMNPLKTWRTLRHYPLPLFFLLTYAITWSFWLPMASAWPHARHLLILGSYGPGAAALIVTALYEGKSGVKALLRPLLIWRVNLFWYLFSLFVTAAIALAAIGLHDLLGGAVSGFNDPRQWYLVIPIFLYVFFFSVLGEEIGWRGYALPRLQSRYSPLSASFILGLIWACWHLPLSFIAGDIHQTIPFSLFLLQELALTIVITWVYNGTRGSLLLVLVLHTASNITLGLFPVLPTETAGDLRPLWIAVALLWILTAFILIHTRAALTTKLAPKVTDETLQLANTSSVPST